jgi:hypothetical protein
MERRTHHRSISSSLLPQHHQSSSSALPTSPPPAEYQAYQKQELNEDDQVAGLQVTSHGAEDQMAHIGLDSIQIVGHQNTATPNH